MKMVRTLTLTEFEVRLRELGIRISREKLKSLIDRGGVFNGVVYKADAKRDEYFILERDFERWVEQNAVEVEPSTDIMAFMAMQGASVGDFGGNE